jgi:enoyl-CoA hydratase/carnithine racemase
MGEMSETLAKPAAETAAEVLYDVADGIATITLNRPERMNAISGPMLTKLSQDLLKANADPKVRVVILTGAGRAFCVGLDLVDATQGSGIGSASQAQAVSVNLDLRNTPPTILFNLDKPTICGRLWPGHRARLRHPDHGGEFEAGRGLREARRSA